MLVSSSFEIWEGKKDKACLEVNYMDINNAKMSKGVNVFS
jgi:hypothetical protein